MASYTRFSNGPTVSRFARDHGNSVRLKKNALAGNMEDAPELAQGAEQETKIRDSARRATASGLHTDGEMDQRSTLLMTVFLIAILIPLRFNVGSFLLNPHRLFLVLMFIPLVINWISGKAGKVHAADFFMIGFVGWMAVSIVAVHGLTRIELIGMNTIETFGAYLAGRVFVRGPKDFDRLLKFLTLAMLIFLPAAVIESTTGIRVFAKIADAIGTTYNWVHNVPGYQKRLGMFRSQMVFEHPILYGVFASTTFAMLYYRMRPDGKTVYGYRRAILSFGNTFFSLSSGAVLSISTQLGIITWDAIMRKVRHHWKILMGLTVLGYVVVDMLSNRTPMEVFISYAAFSPHNGYMRVNIFFFGMQNVWAHPIFGLGMGNWVRPGWMASSSVDNFWLLMAMRHGIPGFLFIALTFLATIIGLARAKVYDLRIINMRKGLVISLIGLAMSMTTVHVWGPAYAFVCFLLGAGHWMGDKEWPASEDEDGQEATNAGPPDKTRRPARGANEHARTRREATTHSRTETRPISK